MRLAVLLACLAGPALADPTGLPLPPVTSPNPMLDPMGGQVAVHSVNAPAGFAETLVAEDAAGVVAWHRDISDDSGEDGNVIVAFADSWPQVGALLQGLGAPEAAAEVAGYDAAVTSLHFIELPATDGAMFLMFVVDGQSPYPVPAGCYARFLLNVVHNGGGPGDFGLRACAEDLGNG